MKGEGAAVAEPTPVDGVEVLGALSPSRAGDFLACPLLYRFRTIDKLPEPPSPAAVRGTIVHQVLEELFDLAAAERTPERAAARVLPSWEAMVAAEPELGEMFPADGPEISTWLDSCRDLVSRYFEIEDPRLLEPAARELYVESLTDSKLLLRGVVDRIDIAADGAIRVVDYKSARAPGPGFEAKPLFQLRFYALVIWRMRGVIPKRLQLIYLGSGEVVHLDPDEADLVATERKVEAIWQAIRRARETGEWLPSPGAMCRWCAHQALCPAYDGTPPPLPEEQPAIDAAEALDQDRR